MNKRVAMVVLSQYPGDPRVRREAEALARCGVEVDILCYRNPDQSEVETFGPITAYRIMDVRDKTSILRYILFSQGFGWVASWRLFQLTRRRHHQVIQIHNMPDQLVFTATWQRLKGIPVVLDLHDLMVELFESKWEGAKARLALPLVKFVEKISCGFASKVITTSEGFRQRLLGRGIPDEKITLVLNAADSNIFYRPADGVMARHAHRGQVLEAPQLVYHGTITHRFGIHVLIQAMAILKEEGLRPSLQLHGKYDEDYRPFLENLIAELGLQEDVNLGGYLLHEEIRDLLYRMDIGVVPYLSDSFMELALSTKSFEYVSMGLPVVASEVAAMTSLFSPRAMRYFQPGDERDLAEQILQYCRNPEMREAYPAVADQEYEEVSWETMERRYTRLIGGLMGVPDLQVTPGDQRG